MTVPGEPAVRNIDLSIVIPVFNGAGCIGRTTTELVAALTDLELKWEIIVVDDGSTDGTADAVVEHPSISVLRHRRNSGKGRALKMGMLRAAGQIRLFTDADLPYGSAIIGPAVAYIRSGCFHAVLGDRALPGSVYGHAGKLRRTASGLASFVFRTLVTGGVYDTQCGFKAFRGDVADALFSLVTIDGFAIDVEIVYLLLKYHLDIKPVPVRLREQTPSSVRIFRDSLLAAADVCRLGWNWMRGRYTSDRLAAIFRADTRAC